MSVGENFQGWHEEMFSHIAGRSKNTIKKAWFIAVKTVIEEYEQKLLAVFLPVLIDDSVEVRCQRRTSVRWWKGQPARS
jgi:hypothetical protein